MSLLRQNDKESFIEVYKVLMEMESPYPQGESCPWCNILPYIFMNINNLFLRVYIYAARKIVMNVKTYKNVVTFKNSVL